MWHLECSPCSGTQNRAPRGCLRCCRAARIKTARLAFALTLLLFFSSRRRHTRYWRDWSSDVCSSDPFAPGGKEKGPYIRHQPPFVLQLFLEPGAFPVPEDGSQHFENGDIFMDNGRNRIGKREVALPHILIDHRLSPAVFFSLNASRLPGWDRSLLFPLKRALQKRLCCALVKIAHDHHGHGFRFIVGLVVLPDIRALDGPDCLLVAYDGSAVGLAVIGQREEFLEQFPLGIVFPHFNLFQYHFSLFFNLIFRKRGVKHGVHQERHALLKGELRHHDVVHRVVVRGKGIHASPERLDPGGHFIGLHRLGALEYQVLDKVGNTRLSERLVAAPHLHPDLNGHHTGAFSLLEETTQSLI